MDTRAIKAVFCSAIHRMPSFTYLEEHLEAHDDPAAGGDGDVEEHVLPDGVVLGEAPGQRHDGGGDGEDLGRLDGLEGEVDADGAVLGHADRVGQTTDDADDGREDDVALEEDGGLFITRPDLPLMIQTVVFVLVYVPHYVEALERDPFMSHSCEMRFFYIDSDLWQASAIVVWLGKHHSRTQIIINKSWD